MITYRILRRIKSELAMSFSHKKDAHSGSYQNSNDSEADAGFTQCDLNDDPELPDRVLNPQMYSFVKMKPLQV